MGRLDGNVAIVVGGASGIGRRCAERFVAEGARVFIADRDGDGVGAAIAALGHNAADGATVNVRDEDAVAAMVARTVRRFGRLDVALNHAAFDDAVTGAPTFITDSPAGSFRAAVDLVLTGTFLCVRYEARELVAAGAGGAIVNVALPGAIRPAEGLAARGAATAGVAMLTRVAALELGRHGIRVNAIAPEAEDPGVAGTSDELANLAVYLASGESASVTGQVLSIDGRGSPA